MTYIIRSTENTVPNLTRSVATAEKNLVYLWWAYDTYVWDSGVNVNDLYRWTRCSHMTVQIHARLIDQAAHVLL